MYVTCFVLRGAFVGWYTDYENANRYELRKIFERSVITALRHAHLCPFMSVRMYEKCEVLQKYPMGCVDKVNSIQWAVSTK